MIQSIKFLINTARKHALSLIVIGLCLLSLGGILVSTLGVPPFSDDTWANYELSKNIFTDFYKVNTYRQYQYPEPYGVSFPPLFPILIALFNFIFGLGVYATYFLNFIILIFILIFLLVLSKELFEKAWYGAIFFLGLLAHDSYVQEIVLGRSQPLATLLILVVTLLLLRIAKNEYSNIFNFGLLGFFCALSSLTRFDFNIAALLIGVALFILMYKQQTLVKKISRVLTYYAIYFLTLLPWMVYSWTRHGVLLANDNTRTVLLAYDNFVSFYLPNPRHVQDTVFTNPGDWLTKTLVNIFQSLDSFISSLFTESNLAILLYLLILAVILLYNLYLKDQKHPFNRELADKYFRVLIVLTPIFVALLGTVFLTGYTNPRYYVNSFLFFSIIILFTFLKLSKGLLHKKVINSLLILIILVSFYHIAIIDDHRITPARVSRVMQKDLLDMGLQDRYYDLPQVLSRLESEPRILIDNLAGIDPATFGGVSGVYTFLPPRNVNSCNLAPLIKNYEINFVYTKNEFWIQTIGENFEYVRVETDENYPLLMIKETKEGYDDGTSCDDKFPDPNYRYY